MCEGSALVRKSNGFRRLLHIQCLHRVLDIRRNINRILCRDDGRLILRHSHPMRCVIGMNRRLHQDEFFFIGDVRCLGNRLDRTCDDANRGTPIRTALTQLTNLSSEVLTPFDVVLTR